MSFPRYPKHKDSGACHADRILAMIGGLTK